MSYGGIGLTRWASRDEHRGQRGLFRRAHARIARAGERREVEAGIADTLDERRGAARGLTGAFVRRVTVIR